MSPSDIRSTQRVRLGRWERERERARERGWWERERERDILVGGALSFGGERESAGVLKRLGTVTESGPRHRACIACQAALEERDLAVEA